MTGAVRRYVPSWLREPLVHFVVLGGVVFGVDRVLVGDADDAHTIVVGADVDSEARETFVAARGRAPSDEELAALHRVWLDNEVLYSRYNFEEADVAAHFEMFRQWEKEAERL
ncbi:MAG: hypothetical protein ACREUE_01620, partial [Panacagrimonas sp.]